MKSVSVRKRERAREVGSVLTDDADRGGAGGEGEFATGKRALGCAILWQDDQ